jgi:phenylacetate-CoA ligase
MSAIQLRRMILDAAEHVPFYRRHWAQAGVDLTRIGSAVHLEFLPVVRREDLLACPAEERLDRRFLALALRSEPARGATARSIELPTDTRTLRRRRMRFLRALVSVGYTPGEKLMLICEPPFPAAAAFLRWKYADLTRGNDATFASFVQTRPSVLYGPLSSLLQIAQRLIASPQVKWRPRLLVSTGEQLTDGKRAFLQSAFGATVADFYSVPEMGLLAHSKPGLSAYQVMTDEFHVELVSAPGTRRQALERFVVTDLAAGPMPLIRFDTGDVVRRDPTAPGAVATAPAVSLEAAPIVGFGALPVQDEVFDAVSPLDILEPANEEPIHFPLAQSVPQPALYSQAMA